MSFSNCEFEMLNRVLDVAIAASVTEYQRQRANATADEELQHIGALAHELRNALSAAVVAFTVIKQGVVGTSGQTSDTLDRSLRRMGDLLDRALAEVRLRKEAAPIMEPLRVAEVFDEIAAMVYPDTQARRQSLEIEVDPDLEIATDRQFFTSAVSNLVQNGLKYTPHGGHIRVRARGLNDRFVIEVEDECGGLPASMANALFATFSFVAPLEVPGRGWACPSSPAPPKHWAATFMPATCLVKGASSRSNFREYPPRRLRRKSRPGSTARTGTREGESCETNRSAGV